MRYLTAALAVLILLLQYPLWLGKGGWLRVWDLDRQVAQHKEQNEKLKRRNNALDAEVRDLKQGFEAVEERARYELGMVRSDEIFFQVIPPVPGGSPAATSHLPAPAVSANPAAVSKSGTGPAGTGVNSSIDIKNPINP